MIALLLEENILRKDSMKVAVCMSGLLRTYEVTAKNIIENLFEPNDVDLFVYAECQNNNRKIEETIETVNETYKDFIVKSEIKKFNFKAELDTMGLEWWKHSNYAHATEGHRKCDKSNNLRIQYEKENNIKYDVVVRLRADFELVGGIINIDDLTFDKTEKTAYVYGGIKNLNIPSRNNHHTIQRCISEGHIPADNLEENPYYTSSIWDGFMIADPETINIANQLKDNYLFSSYTSKKCGHYGPKNSKNPEAKLLTHLHKNNVTVKTLAYALGEEKTFVLRRTPEFTWTSGPWDIHPEIIESKKEQIIISKRKFERKKDAP